MTRHARPWLAEVVVLAWPGVGEENLFPRWLLPAIRLLRVNLVFGLLHVGPKLRFLP